jgi:hypothetical protein
MADVDYSGLVLKSLKDTEALRKADLDEAEQQYLAARGNRVLYAAGYIIGDIVEVKSDKGVRRLVIIGAGCWPLGRHLLKNGFLGGIHGICWYAPDPPPAVVGHQALDVDTPVWIKG